MKRPIHPGDASYHEQMEVEAIVEAVVGPAWLPWFQLAVLAAFLFWTFYN